MFDNFDFSKMGEMLQEAQKKGEEMKEKMAAQEFIAKSGGGLVEVKMNGNGEVLDINIDDSLLEDKESLQILLIAAINDAVKSSNDAKLQALSSVLGGPFGGFGL